MGHTTFELSGSLSMFNLNISHKSNTDDGMKCRSFGFNFNPFASKKVDMKYESITMIHPVRFI